jgi:hypothetical protein
VAGNVGLRQTKRFLKVAHAELFVSEERHDAKSGFIAQSSEKARNRADLESGRHMHIRISECPICRKPLEDYFALVRRGSAFLTGSGASSFARTVFGADAR